MARSSKHKRKIKNLKKNKQNEFINQQRSNH